jgi:dihydropteroate synthase
LALADQLLIEGADILDLGGESTRPGAIPLSHEQEWRRIEPVIKEILTWNKPLSLDTYHPENMRKALDLGVDIINDIHALRVQDAMSIVAPYTCGVCLMHMHGEPLSMQQNPMSDPAVLEVVDFFIQQLKRTEQSGIQRDRLVLDPGIGFGKTVAQNFQLLARQADLLRLGIPLMAGWSRKSALGAALAQDGQVPDPGQRQVASVAAALMAVDRGASVVRVHDVKHTVDALKIWSSAQQHAG